MVIEEVLGKTQRDQKLNLMKKYQLIDDCGKRYNGLSLGI